MFNVYPSLCHIEYSYNMHPIGISTGVVKFECTILNPTLSNFNALNTGYEEKLQALSIFFIGGKSYYTCNCYLCLLTNHKNAFSIHNKTKTTFSYLYM